MAVIIIPPPARNAYNAPVWHCSGNVVVLDNIYDPRQLWFPFGLLFRVSVEPEMVRYAKAHKRPSEKQKNRKVPYEKWPQAISIERDVHQFVLPFREFLHQKNGLVKRLMEAEYPAFDRGFDGLVLGGVTQQVWPQVLKWCEHNCQGRYITKDSSNRRLLIFEKRCDYMRARLIGLYD